MVASLDDLHQDVDPGSVEGIFEVEREVSLEPGGAYLMDYRLCHGGTKNTGQIPRPILYIVYSKPWFRDAENFKKRTPLRMSEQQLEDVPQEHDALFARARERLFR